MARTLNNFKTDDLGMSFKKTVMGSFIHLVCVYAGCDQFFWPSSPLYAHMCAFSVTLSLSTIIYIQYKISFHVKIYVQGFYIQIWFKCEAQLLFFQIKTTAREKKHFIEKIWKLFNYIFYTHDVTCKLSWWNNESIDIYKNEVRNSRVTKSSYKIELCKMTSHFELLKNSKIFI